MKAHLMAAASAVGLLVAAPGLAAPPDEVYDFAVVEDSAYTPPLCDLQANICNTGQPPTTLAVPVPYRLATLAMTHDALTAHTAQASDETTPITDDHRIITMAFAGLPPSSGCGLTGCGGDGAPPTLSIPMHNPFCTAGYQDRLFETLNPSAQCPDVFRQKIGGDGYTLDLHIVGDQLSGTIKIFDVQQHGDGCEIEMTGKDNVWQGFWACFVEGSGGSYHTVTATSTRVEGTQAQN